VAERAGRLVRRRPGWTVTGLLVTASLFRSAQYTGQTTFPLLARDRLGAGSGAVGAVGTASGVVMVLAAVVLTAKLSTRAPGSAVAAGSPCWVWWPRSPATGG
jgi:hypothetical protein